MAISRADAEFLLVARLGPLLEAADLAVTVVGSNAALNSPIGQSIRSLGYAVTSLVSVSDADVAQVTVAQYDEFLDVAEYQALETILGHLDNVDLGVGPRNEKLSQLAAQAERKAKRLLKRLTTLYGFGLTAPTAGVITAVFAEHG